MKFKALSLLSLVGMTFLSGVETAASPSLTFTPYGLAHYRLRGDFTTQTDSADNELKQKTYSHRIGYYLGVKAQVHEKLSLQIQIGNDWVNTEAVSYKANNNSNYTTKSIFPYFHLAFASFTPGPFSFLFGKIPVESYGPLDLLERSIATNTYGSKGGLGASFMGWVTGTNNSLIGLKAEIPVLKKESKLSFNLTYAIIDGDAVLNTIRGQALSADPKNNPSEQLLILDIPIAVKNLTITPQVFTVLNRNTNKYTEKSDHEFGAGLAAGLKAEKVSFRARGGVATYNNENTRSDYPVNDTTRTTLAKLEQFGFIGSVGTTVAAGPGSILFDVAVSTDENKKKSGSKVVYPYIDARYSYSPVKNLDFIPRVRAFITKFDETNEIDKKVLVRPELIIQAKF